MRFVLHDIKLALPSDGIEREFNICSENTTRAQRMKAAVRGMVNLKVVKFADDIFVGANSREELLVMMRIIAEKFENFGMKLAESKTVTMTWNTTDMLEHIWIKNVKNVLFLKKFNQSISPHFQSETKILLVDLASAEKITETIGRGGGSTPTNLDAENLSY